MSSSDIEDKAGKPYLSASPSSSDQNLPPTPTKRGFLGTLRHYEEVLDRRLGVESSGPARILPEERDPAYSKWNNQIVMALMWASGTMNLSCFTTGFLGHELGLNLSQTIYITILASFIGAAVTGWCATMGPATGLRQVSICRYSIGWWPAKIIAALNVVEQVGWSSVGCITGGLALSAVSDGHINLVLGVVIIAVIGLLFSFFGLRAVLSYEKYAWAVFLIIFLVM
jgi:purine-cytosine permease-like protein